MKRHLLLALVLAVAALVAPASAPAAPTGLSDVTCTSGVAGIARLDECVVTSAALNGASVKVRVLKPAEYRETGDAHPVLLLLHGCCSSLQDGAELWTRPQNGDAARIAEPYDFVVVMPSGDHHGWYTDWVGGGPAWETHHLREILPWVEQTYNASDDRSQRFVAGLSMGGYGAMEYAARRPDLFRGAASFSGAVDIMLPGARQFIDGVLNAGDKPWGDPETNEVGWRGRNPVDLATNLRPLDAIRLTTGTGAPGEREAHEWQGGTQPGYSQFAFEVGVNRMTHNLSDALSAASITHELDDYVIGTHIWHYWRVELGQILPAFAALAAGPADVVESFDYRSIDPAFEMFGWSFTADAGRAPEFLDVTAASAGGVTLRGSGLTSVTTGPLFTPGATVALTGATSPAAVADADGRITFQVDLGPAHTLKQYTREQAAAEAASLGAYWTTRTVTFSS